MTQPSQEDLREQARQKYLEALENAQNNPPPEPQPPAKPARPSPRQRAEANAMGLVEEASIEVTLASEEVVTIPFKRCGNCYALLLDDAHAPAHVARCLTKGFP